MFGVLLLFICICFSCMSMRLKYAMIEEKSSVDPEDPEFELLCVSKPKASVLDHLAPTFVLL